MSSSLGSHPVLPGTREAMGGPGTKLSDQTLNSGNGIRVPDSVSHIAAYNVRPFASKDIIDCVNILNLIGV